MYTGTRIREWTAHQTNTRLLSKLEFVYGTLSLMAEAIGVQDKPVVQETLGEAASYVEIIKSILLAAEHEAEIDSVQRSDLPGSGSPSRSDGSGGRVSTRA